MRLKIDRRLNRWPALRACIRALYAVVQLFVPSCRNQIAFVSHPDCSDNAYALFQNVIRSPRAKEFCLVWLVNNAEVAKETISRECSGLVQGQVKIVKKNTLRGLFCYLRSRYVFYTHTVYWFACPGSHQVVVNLWHGMPIKNIGVLTGTPVSSAHYSLATSNFFADIMAEALALPRERILVTGLPRNEWLFDRDPKGCEMRDGCSKLIVWLPTFRQFHRDGYVRNDAALNAEDPLSLNTLAELDERLDNSGARVLVKLHPGDVKNQQAWPTYRNIRIYSDEQFRAQRLNLYKVLATADALVTDFSSIAIDFLLVDKAIGFFAPDMAAYTRGFIQRVLSPIAAIGYQLRSVQEFAEFATNPPRGRSMAPEAEILHQHDLCNSSERILNAFGLTCLSRVGLRPDVQETCMSAGAR